MRRELQSLCAAGRFGMRSALLCASSAERLFIISSLTRSAERVRRFFHGWVVVGNCICSACFLRKRGAAAEYPFRLAASRQSTFRKGTALGATERLLIALDTLVLMATACALSVKPCRTCQIPPFVAARHLPPERGKFFLKGRAKSTAGNVLIAPNTLAMSFTAWLSLWESWRGSA